MCMGEHKDAEDDAALLDLNMKNEQMVLEAAGWGGILFEAKVH